MGAGELTVMGTDGSTLFIHSRDEYLEVEADASGGVDAADVDVIDVGAIDTEENIHQ